MMLHSRPDSIALRLLGSHGDHHGPQHRSQFRFVVLFGVCTVLFAIALPRPSAAQDWSADSDDDWSQPTNSRSPQAGSGGSGPSTGWSLRAGIGFIDDPNAFLLNIEAPYAFDQWVSIGPMFQIGLHNNNTIVAPSVNVTVTIPDLPGGNLDRFLPYGFVGMGFAYIEDDNRRNSNSAAGFLINFGFGLEYQVSERFFVGSQMMFNFLPAEVLDEHFFYSWQIAGARFAF
jgi:hypothetical protein